MRKFSKKQIIIGGIAVAALAVGGGAAYAYWTSNGSGDGSATTDTTSAYTVTVDDVNLTDLSPGGPIDTVPYHIKNNDSGAGLAPAVAVTVTGTQDALGNDVPGCTANDFTIVSNTFPALGGVHIAAHATDDESFKIQMLDTDQNQDACKSVKVLLHVAVTNS